MKLNTLVTFVTMMILASTENGIVKGICWGILFVDFLVFLVIFDRKAAEYEGRR